MHAVRIYGYDPQEGTGRRALLEEQEFANGTDARWFAMQAREDRNVRVAVWDGTAETSRDIRYHSSEDMAGLGECRDVTEPVAIVLRRDGSIDVYGQVGIVDQV